MSSPADSYTEMVQVGLPNDANPLGFILGGTVMHLIDIAGAIACHRHTRSLLVTAAVDGLQFLHSIKVGDMIILQARVTATWTTSLEETLTGVRKMTSRAYLTFVAIDREGGRVPIPPLTLTSDAERQKAAEAAERREARLKSKQRLNTNNTYGPVRLSDVAQTDALHGMRRSLFEDQPGAVARREDVVPKVDTVDASPDFARRLFGDGV
jgi:acyl-CoA hydrolase